MRNLALVERAKQAFATGFLLSHFDMQIGGGERGPRMARKTINASRANPKQTEQQQSLGHRQGQILLIPSYPPKNRKRIPKTQAQKTETEPNQMHNVCCQIRPLCRNQTTIKGEKAEEEAQVEAKAPKENGKREAHFMVIGKRWVMFYGREQKRRPHSA